MGVGCSSKTGDDGVGPADTEFEKRMLTQGALKPAAAFKHGFAT